MSFDPKPFEVLLQSATSEQPGPSFALGGWRCVHKSRDRVLWMLQFWRNVCEPAVIGLLMHLHEALGRMLGEHVAAAPHDVSLYHIHPYRAILMVRVGIRGNSDQILDMYNVSPLRPVEADMLVDVGGMLFRTDRTSPLLATVPWLQALHNFNPSFVDPAEAFLDRSPLSSAIVFETLMSEPTDWMGVLVPAANAWMHTVWHAVQYYPQMRLRYNAADVAQTFSFLTGKDAPAAFTDTLDALSLLCVGTDTKNQPPAEFWMRAARVLKLCATLCMYIRIAAHRTLGVGPIPVHTPRVGAGGAAAVFGVAVNAGNAVEVTIQLRDPSKPPVRSVVSGSSSLMKLLLHGDLRELYESAPMSPHESIGYGVAAMNVRYHQKMVGGPGGGAQPLFLMDLL